MVAVGRSRLRGERDARPVGRESGDRRARRERARPEHALGRRDGRRRRLRRLEPRPADEVVAPLARQPPQAAPVDPDRPDLRREVAVHEDQASAVRRPRERPDRPRRLQRLPRPATVDAGDRYDVGRVANDREPLAVGRPGERVSDVDRETAPARAVRPDEEQARDVLVRPHVGDPAAVRRPRRARDFLVARVETRPCEHTPLAVQRLDDDRGVVAVAVLGEVRVHERPSVGRPFGAPLVVSVRQPAAAAPVRADDPEPIVADEREPPAVARERRLVPAGAGDPAQAGAAPARDVDPAAAVAIGDRAAVARDGDRLEEAAGRDERGEARSVGSHAVSARRAVAVARQQDAIAVGPGGRARRRGRGSGEGDRGDRGDHQALPEPRV